MGQRSFRLYLLGFVTFALLCNAKVTYAVPIALDFGTVIDVSSGSGTAFGFEVGTGHQIFQFDAFAGNLISIGVAVTTILPGTFFTDDDTLLFLFNDLGLMLAFDDDDDDLLAPPGLFTSFKQLPLLTTGTYFVGVTTFANFPTPFSLVPLAAPAITGWEDDGESRVIFNLNVSGVVAPPPPPGPPLPPGPPGGPPPTSVPEPSSLILIGSLVVSGLGVKGVKMLKRRYYV